LFPENPCRCGDPGILLLIHRNAPDVIGKRTGTYREGYMGFLDEWGCAAVNVRSLAVTSKCEARQYKCLKDFVKHVCSM
jgi:hypothetical protein